MLAARKSLRDLNRREPVFAYTDGMQTAALRQPAPRPAPNAVVASVAAILLAAGALWIGAAHGGRMAALWLTGAALGIALYHARFGFTGAWRAFLVERRGSGVRAQMVLFALATLLILPAVDAGALFGRPVGGAFAPAGVSVAVGAFVFGIGMQLGGGCASGTLFATGGGDARSAITLVFFVAGATLGSLHLPWWLTLPDLGTVSLGKTLGTSRALVVELGLFFAVWYGSRILEQRRHGHILHAGTGGVRGLRRLVHGPWPITWGALALAILAVLALWISGHPWSVTFGFSLWGAKMLSAAGVDVAAWEFWTWPYPKQALAGSIFAEDTSVMDIGIVLGALLASGLAGRFAPSFRIRLRPFLAAVIGGLMLGYGARLAFGCNIGALFSGIASGSLHGWLWLVAALPGNWLGARLRSVFDL